MSKEWAGNGHPWVSFANKRPPENVKLDTISPGGIQQALIFSRGLFWFPDMVMYVYYTPMLWRLIVEKDKNG